LNGYAAFSKTSFHPSIFGTLYFSSRKNISSHHSEVSPKFLSSSSGEKLLNSRSSASKSILSIANQELSVLLIFL
jgi:hypothetical protein